MKNDIISPLAAESSLAFQVTLEGGQLLKSSPQHHLNCYQLEETILLKFTQIKNLGVILNW